MSEQIFAVVDNGVVVNVIVADDVFAASIAAEHEAVVDITSVMPQPGIGWSHIDSHLVAPQPHPSWLLDEQFEWQPPVVQPEGDNWRWDESTLSWVDTSA